METLIEIRKRNLETGRNPGKILRGYMFWIYIKVKKR